MTVEGGEGRWDGQDRLDDLMAQRGRGKWSRFSWLTIGALLSSANDTVAKWAPEIVLAHRAAWIRALGTTAQGGSVVDEPVCHEGVKAFLVVGDPGEQDRSQYVLVPALEAQDEVGFMVICSDVIYPAGEARDYEHGFHLPYGDLSWPIHALPGNHDWYDTLHGFMWNFCGQDEGAPAAKPESRRARFLTSFWGKPSRRPTQPLTARRDARLTAGGCQPGPYFALRLGDRLLVVCIDTGVTGEIDVDQAEWLLRMSKREGPKLLLTGKPLVVNGRRKVGRIFDLGGHSGTVGGFRSVDEIIRCPAHEYVAAIGGDVHNYQRYSDDHGSGRAFHCLVSGGGGAYTGATYTVPLGGTAAREGEPAVPAASACYPDRARSLQSYAARLVPALGRLLLCLAAIVGMLLITCGVASWGGLSDAALEAILVGCGVALAVWAIGRTALPERLRTARLYRASRLLACAVLGASLGLAGWWLEPDRLGWNLLAAVAIALGGSLVAVLLRRTRWWRRWPAAWVGGQFALAVGGLIVFAPSASARGAYASVLLGILVGASAGVAIFALSRRFSLPGIALLGLTALAAVVGAAVLDGDASTAFLAGTAAVLVPVAAVLALDKLHGWLPRAYKLVVMALLTAAVVVLAATGAVGESLARVAVAIAAIDVVALVAIAVVHLSFLYAFTPAWRKREVRRGELSDDEAEAAIRRWNGASVRLGASARTIADFVHPLPDKPSGPIQKLVAEIFDRDEPPFDKSFLRVELGDDVLRIVCFKVTGEAPGLCQEVETVDVPLKAPVA